MFISRFTFSFDLYFCQCIIYIALYHWFVHIQLFLFCCICRVVFPTFSFFSIYGQYRNCVTYICLSLDLYIRLTWNFVSVFFTQIYRISSYTVVFILLYLSSCISDIFIVYYVVLFIYVCMHVCFMYEWMDAVWRAWLHVIIINWLRKTIEENFFQTKYYESFL